MIIFLVYIYSSIDDRYIITTDTIKQVYIIQYFEMNNIYKKMNLKLMMRLEKNLYKLRGIWIRRFNEFSKIW